MGLTIYCGSGHSECIASSERGKPTTSVIMVIPSIPLENNWYINLLIKGGGDFKN